MQALREGGRLSGRVERAAIELKRQPRYHFDLALRPQIANEWQGEPQVAHLMRSAHGPIHEINRPALHGDVVEHKTHGGRLRITGLRKALHDVIDIGLPGHHLGDAQHRCIHLQGINHWRHAQQGLQLGIYIDTPHPQQGIFALEIRNSHIVQAQFQRPGKKLHLADGDLAPEGLRSEFFTLAAQDGRHRQPAQQPEQYDGGNRQSQSHGPPGLLERRHKRRKIHGRWPQRSPACDSLHWTRVQSRVRNGLKQESPVERHSAAPPGLTADTTVFAIGSQRGEERPACEGARYCPQGVALEAPR